MVSRSRKQSLSLVAFLLLFVKTNAYFETLRALNLIGSHFGVPGNATYDYVVVGGGTAGLTLAKRLSENSSNTVAVVEAGSFYELDNGNLSSIPAYSVYGLGNNPASFLINPRIDWKQYTVPQPALQNLPLFYPTGRTLGGGSARNYQGYLRGTVDSYDRWAQMVGDDSYKFSSFLPFFKKSLSFHPPPVASAIHYNLSSFVPGNGPLQISYGTFTPPVTPYMELAMHQAGLATSSDFSSGALNGYGTAPFTQDPILEQRSSSETSFLRQALEQSLNYAIFTNALAKKVLFDSSKKASGVLVETAGVEYLLSAKKEVIVSCGAFRSPQLLMVSGVGPRTILNLQKIPIVHESPGVGQNMWDQPLFGPSWRVNVLTHSALGNASYTAQATAQYISNRTGILSSEGAGTLAFEKLPAKYRANLKPSTRAAFDSSWPADWPEIEYLTIDAWAGLQQDYILGAPQTGFNYVSLTASLNTPFSRGNVTLQSADTNVNPLISPNWLEDPRDQDFAIQMFRRTRDIFASPGIQPILVGEEAFPGPNVTTDAQILQNIRRSLSTIHHASTTCAMGRSNDTMAVVDTHARVYGVSALRVVDASTFPLLPPGHPQATVYALAEKIAQDIKNGN